MADRGDATILLHHPRATIIPHLPTVNVIVELRDTSAALEAFTKTGMRHIKVPAVPVKNAAMVLRNESKEDGNLLSEYDVKTIVNRVMDEVRAIERSQDVVRR